jgi:hypothetical protein
MKNKRRLTVLCLVYLIAALVASCQPPVPPTPTDTAVPIETPQPTGIDIAGFALNEIIVTGPLGNVDNVIGDPAARGLELISEVDLSYLIERAPQERDEFPKAEGVQKLPLRDLFEANTRSLVMRLYQNLDDISTLLFKVQEINDAGNGTKVFADPNYMTDPLEPGSCSNPYSGGGSPYSGGGSPMSGLGLDIGMDAFGNQWAFKSESAVAGGVSLPPNSLVQNSEVPESPFSGSGTTVGVFDTAPWTIPASPWSDTPTFTMLDGSTFEFSIVDAVNKYYPLTTLTSLSTPTPRVTPTPASTTINVRDHGLFIASQIHAVAPNSDIYLYRVLGDDGCGNLFILAAAMHEFIRDLSLPTKSLDKVVINLSLGVHIPDDLYYQLESEDNLPPEIVALNLAIYKALEYGAIVVAASGNDSAPKPSEPLNAQRMQLPAFYEDVIGVAANNQDGQRSCFSNQGDIAAPGGDGGPKQSTNPGEPENPCGPRTELGDALATPRPCDSADMSMCHYGLVGLSLESPSSYGLWSGTSFAAPLVSGLAALAFEKAQGDRASVYCLITTGARSGDAALGWGTIDVSRSLILEQCP